MVGISADTLELQQKFTDQEKLNFPLIADPDKAAIKAFGALHPSGKLANRYTFVVDKQGVIRKVYTKVGPAGHPDEVLKFVKENLAKG